MEARADVDSCNARGESVAWTAASEGSVTMLSLLMARRADVHKASSDGSTPFLMASAFDRSRVLRLLRDAGADMSRVDKESVAPLLAAVRRGCSPETATFLIEHRADLERPSRSGITPLWAAARGGHERVLKVLLAARADPDRPSRFGVTPLGIAASRQKRQKIAGALLMFSASCNKADDHGASPLWMASLRGHRPAVETLLSARAEISANKKGTTPSQIAQKAGHQGIAELLKQSSEAPA